MLKVLCLLLVFAGACVMLASIIVYRKTIRVYADDLPVSKTIVPNRFAAILILMVFFLLGYMATLFFIATQDAADMSTTLVAVIFFFGAIFCFAVVYVQSELLSRLEHSKNELRKALSDSMNTNSELEKLNVELIDTMDALKSAQRQLIFSEKMSTLGRLVAGVSHEINTPLGVILASAQSMEESFSQPFYQLLTDIRALADEDFNDFLHYLEVSVANTRGQMTTSEIRALKREAKNSLSGLEGFDSTVLDLLTRSCLLDSDTIDSLRSRLGRASFAPVLSLMNRLLRIITSVDNIGLSAERIVRLITSLKTFSHVSAHNSESSFNVIKGIEAVLSIFTNQLKYNIEVETLFELVPNIKGYEDELGQVWSNLIQNAIHAMQDPSGTGEAEHASSRLTVAVRSEGEHVIVSMADNGTGIPEDKIADIFEPFYTTKPTGIGTGLGLSISRQIVEKHGGTIGVRSQSGRGTTFTITLPVA